MGGEGGVGEEGRKGGGWVKGGWRRGCGSGKRGRMGRSGQHREGWCGDQEISVVSGWKGGWGGVGEGWVEKEGVVSG